MRDEADMLELAIFLDKIVRYTPGGQVSEPVDVSALMNSGEAIAKPSGTHSDQDVYRGIKGLSLNNVKLVDGTSQASMGHIMSFAGQNLVDFELHPPFDADTIASLVELYKSHGRLASTSYQEIVRANYQYNKDLPNVMHCSIPEGGQVTVVGDLHGNVEDLLYILDTEGMPGPEQLFLFNGDFVDRGKHGCEVLALVMALQVVYPAFVFLNRGNHEDEAICRVYGFEEECLKKYDKVTMSCCSLAFKHLPLATIIDETVCVLHGGLFHREDVTLQDIDAIPRAEYGAIPPEAEGQSNPGWYRSLPLAKQRPYMLMQINRELLWSDPMAENGRKVNKRGSGMLIGPDMCEAWLQRNGLSLLVRSHEAVPNGFDLPYFFEGGSSSLASGQGARTSEVRSPASMRQSVTVDFTSPARESAGALTARGEGHVRHASSSSTRQKCCCTVFSASDYCGSGNKACYVNFKRKRRGNLPEEYGDHATEAVDGGDLVESSRYYVVRQFYTGEEKPDLSAYNTQSLRGFVLKRRGELKALFARRTGEDGTVSCAEWEEIMAEATDLQIHWASVIPIIAPPDSLRQGGARIHVQSFLSDYEGAIRQRIKEEAADEERDDETTASEVMDALYANHHRLIAVFRFFDRDGNGIITPDEFKEGCELLNDRIPEGEGKLVGIDRILSLIDFDNSGEIDLNEFLEVNRLVDAADGRMDGVIDYGEEEREERK